MSGLCCAKAELAGLQTAYGGSDGSFFRTENGDLAKRVCLLVRKSVSAKPVLRTLMRGRRKTFYRVHLERAGALSAPFPQEIPSRECCRRAYLRGAFLALGTASDPEKGYHIEWRCSAEKQARDLKRIARKYAPNVSIIKRGDDTVVYCKGAEQIADLFRAMGAAASLMRLENVRIYKDMRNQANRIVNCESANVDKATAAAQSQIESIRYLEERGAFQSLPKELLETAEARLNHPEATLEELGSFLLKPVGKSGINHRMRKLTALARSIREKESTAW